MHRAWSSIVEVPYCFSRSYVKFQGHTALKIFNFDPNWAFSDCNSSLNSPMAMKCCTKLEAAKERCPIVFQGHPSNFKVTRYKTSPILTQIGRFWTIGRSQVSNPSDLPCYLFIFWGVGGWGLPRFGGGTLSCNVCTIWCCMLISRLWRVFRRFRRHSCLHMWLTRLQLWVLWCINSVKAPSEGRNVFYLRLQEKARLNVEITRN